MNAQHQDRQLTTEQSKVNVTWTQEQAMRFFKDYVMAQYQYQVIFDWGYSSIEQIYKKLPTQDETIDRINNYYLELMAQKQKENMNDSFGSFFQQKLKSRVKNGYRGLYSLVQNPSSAKNVKNKTKKQNNSHCE